MNGPPCGGTRVGLFLGMAAALLLAVLLLQHRGAPPGEPDRVRPTPAAQALPAASGSPAPRPAVASSTPAWPRPAPGPAAHPASQLRTPAPPGEPELPASILNN